MHIKKFEVLVTKPYFKGIIKMLLRKVLRRVKQLGGLVTFVQEMKRFRN